MKHKSDGFKGIKEVFSFTFCQTLKKKGFMISTVVGILILLAGMILVQLFIDRDKMSSTTEEEAEIFSISSVYFYNNTELPIEDLSVLGQMDERYKELSVKMTDMDRKEAAEEWKNEDITDAVYISLDKTQKAYKICTYLSQEGEADKDDAKDLSASLKELIEQTKLMNAPVSEEVLLLVLAPVSTEVVQAGEKAESMEMMIIKLIFPMLASFVIYFMVLLYGQSISKEIIAEKSSKLMESLLLMVEPYGIIGGKILAMISLAFLQIVLWLASALGGYFVGDAILSTMMPQEEHTLYNALRTLKQLAEGASFSLPAIVLAIVSILFGFSLFCVLAGLVSSTAAKAEDLSQLMVIFQVVVVLCFLVSYMLPIMQSEASKLVCSICRYIPFTAAFMLPADVLVGNISIAGCIVSLCILAVVMAGLVFWMGDIYKKGVFYNGTK